jgi:hypothetical protein
MLRPLLLCEDTSDPARADLAARWRVDKGSRCHIPRGSTVCQHTCARCVQEVLGVLARGGAVATLQWHWWEAPLEFSLLGTALTIAISAGVYREQRGNTGHSNRMHTVDCCELCRLAAFRMILSSKRQHLPHSPMLETVASVHVDAQLHMTSACPRAPRHQAQVL